MRRNSFREESPVGRPTCFVIGFGTRQRQAPTYQLCTTPLTPTLVTDPLQGSLLAQMSELVGGGLPACFLARGRTKVPPGSISVSHFTGYRRAAAQLLQERMQQATGERTLERYENMCSAVMVCDQQNPPVEPVLLSSPHTSVIWAWSLGCQLLFRHLYRAGERLESLLLCVDSFF